MLTEDAKKIKKEEKATLTEDIKKEDQVEKAESAKKRGRPKKEVEVKPNN